MKRYVMRCVTLVLFVLSLTTVLSTAQNATYGNLVVTGTGDFQGASTMFGDWSEGSGSPAGLTLNFTDGTTTTVNFIGSGTTTIWQWSQNRGAASYVSLKLNQTNELLIYTTGTSGTAGIILNPSNSGSSTFSGEVTVGHGMSISGTVYNYGNWYFYGGDNEMQGQTLVNGYSVLTEYLADGRYPSISLFYTGTSTDGYSQPTLVMGGGTAAGGYSIAIGNSANAQYQGDVVIGYEANATWQDSTAIGWNAQSDGAYTTAIGYYAETGDVYSAVAIGFEAYAFGDSSSAYGMYADASGEYSTAIGVYSHGDGADSSAFGYSSVAEGDYSTASGYEADSGGNSSSAFGYEANASEDYSTAVGYQANSDGYSSAAMGYEASASGQNANAIGANTDASGDYSTALGQYAEATGEQAIALGNNAYGSGNSSIALGYYSGGDGDYSIAFGYDTYAEGNSSVSGGAETRAYGDYSISFGYNSSTSGSYSFASGAYSTTSGVGSAAPGYSSNAAGDYSTAAGPMTTGSAYGVYVVGQYNVPEGDPNNWVATDDLFVVGNGTNSGSPSDAFVVNKQGDVNFTGNLYQNGVLISGSGVTSSFGGLRLVVGTGSAAGSYASAIGSGVSASGAQSLAQGYYTSAGGNNSVALGNSSYAGGESSMAFGYGASASSNYSLAAGDFTAASGTASTALGISTSAGGEGAVSAGYATGAWGSDSFSIGSGNGAYGNDSIAMGSYTYTDSFAQVSIGQWNIQNSGSVASWVPTDELFVVGNGTSGSNKSDAMVIRKNGNTTVYGNLAVSLTGTSAVSCTEELASGTGGSTVAQQVLSTGTGSWQWLYTSGTTPYKGMALDPNNQLILYSGTSGTAGITLSPSSSGTSTLPGSVNVNGALLVSSTSGSLNKISNGGLMVTGSASTSGTTTTYVASGTANMLLVPQQGDLSMGSFTAGAQPH